MVPTTALPPAMLSTLHAGVPPPLTVAVNCCVRVNAMPAARGDTTTALAAIVTVALIGALVPPLPVQVME